MGLATVNRFNYHHLVTPTDDDLPLLGEPLAIELANTRYGAGDDAFDFLGTAPLALRWLRAALRDEGVDLSASEVDELRAVRDAIYEVIVARCEGEIPPPWAVAAVNRASAAAPAHAELLWAPGAPPRAQVVFEGAPPATLIARAATSAIELCTQERPVRRCQGPGCALLFVQDHGRRRFCHDGCGHRARQRRYRRRIR